MPTEQQIVSWKSGAWSTPADVAAYAARLSEPSGPQILKTALERALIDKYVVPTSVLDVGIGTGRASLPLAMAGYGVTGLDTSGAMLKECKVQAGSIPVSLVQGDLMSLPFEGQSFDNVLSLDALIHFPGWQRAVAELQRVTRPGGRILFDYGSKDHDPQSTLSEKSVMGFTVAVSASALCEFATQYGMRVLAIVPYGILAGSGAPNRFFRQTALGGRAWDRLLSWTVQSPSLLAFLVFLEQELGAYLSTAASSRVFVVLENAPDAQANALAAATNAQKIATLSSGLNAQTLNAVGIDAHRFRASLARHLEYQPNGAVLHRVLRAASTTQWPVTLADFLSGDALRNASSALQRAKADVVLTDFIGSFHHAQTLEDAYTYRGVDLGVAWEAELMIALLAGPLAAFDE